MCYAVSIRSLTAGTEQPMLIGDGQTVIFKENGTLAFWHQGWIENEQHPVKFTDGHWFVFYSPSSRRQLDIHAQLEPTIHFSPYLETNGRVFCWRKEKGRVEKYPTRIVEEAWEYYAQGEWRELFVDVY